MLCGSIGPPFKLASACGEAAHALEGFKIPGLKPAADAVTSPALMKSRRENSLFFMAFLPLYANNLVPGIGNKVFPRHQIQTKHSSSV
jgi:hypothetical protein